jgi:GT2 family glycosyltransferase
VRGFVGSSAHVIKGGFVGCELFKGSNDFRRLAKLNNDAVLAITHNGPWNSGICWSDTEEEGMARVSVLVAAHKPTYLREALGSAVAQSEKDLEVVVVDDSGGGLVQQIVHSTDDERLRYVRNDVSLGPANSYQRAIAEASAPIIGVLNDDDMWETSLVERLLEPLDSVPDAVLAFGDHWVMVDGVKDERASSECSARWKRDTLAQGLHRPFQRMALIDKSVPLAVAALFRRSAVEDASIPHEVGGSYDLWLSYRLCRAGAGAVYVPERLASWRVHSANLTHVASPERAEANAYLYRVMATDAQLRVLQPELDKAYSEALWPVAALNLRFGSRRRAIGSAATASRLGNYKAALLIPAALLPKRVLAWARAG